MPKNSVINSIIELENLHWAWEKIKYFYSQEDFWSDALEIATFQANYEDELQDIKNAIKKGTYKLTPIKPIFFPKKADDEGKTQNRQMFWIALKDQLVWLAVMNIVGKYYDCQMPYWSYGNRLYISMFPDKEFSTEEKITWEYGPYRNTTKKTYRSFGQSWPRFRKDIYITSKVIKNKVYQLTDAEKDDLKINSKLSELHKVKYKETAFWNNTDVENSDIYWCSLDLKKFYPNAKISVILENFIKYGNSLDKRFYDFEKLIELFKNLLNFKIDFDIGMNDNINFDAIHLNEKRKSFDGIPTGLFAAGFLSNISMLEVDSRLNKFIEENSKSNRRVALFRFVDDYTIISPSFSSSIELIKEIEQNINSQFNQLKINIDKTKPDALKKFLLNKKDRDIETLANEAMGAMKIDANFPTPLMNHTLKKISMSNKLPFELLDSEEEKNFLLDIEHLLVTDISEEEIREDTRLSFASSKLSILVPKKKYEYTEIYDIKCQIKDCQEQIFLIKQSGNFSDKDNEKIKQLDKEIDKLNTELKTAKYNLQIEIQKDRERTASLLKFAIVNYPDKLKLWKNLINFYKNIGFNDENEGKELLDILEIIEHANKTSKINIYTYEYLITYIYNVLTNSIISAIKRLMSSNISQKERLIKSSFLKNLFLEKVLKVLDNYTFSSFYFKQSKELFALALVICQHYFNNQNKDDSFKYFQNINEEKQLKYYCWMIEKFDLELSKPYIEKYLENYHISNNIGYFIASMYPSINLKSINSILLTKTNKYFPFSWWFNYYSNIENIHNIDKIINDDARNSIKILDSNYEIQIFKYIEKYQYSEENALNIIRSIIEKYQVKSEDILNTKNKDEKVIQQFPYNIYVKNDNNKSNIEIHNILNIKVKDKRYFPDFVDFDVNNKDKQFIYGIGILLYQLITKDLFLPEKFYQPSSQLIYSNYFVSQLNNYHISSFSYEIIKACLSKRNRELEKLNIENFEENDFKDEDKENIKIGTIDLLLEYINKSIIFLQDKKYISGDITRYLIPKKLFSLTSNFNNNTVENKNKNLKIGYIQINFDNMTAWGPSDNITLSIKPEVESYIWQEVLKGFHKLNNHHTKPDIIVIPELTIPNPYLYELTLLAKEINAVVFAGIDWIITGNKIQNKAIMIVPNNWNTLFKSTYCNYTFLGKKNPANLEKISIEEYNNANHTTYEFSPDDNMYLIDAKEFGKIGFAICADFYDIERFVVYKGRVQHIIILALNQDTNSFFAISEAVARLVMCNVVICNNGFFGDSLAFSPYKTDYKRMIYRNQGANLFSTQVVTLPVQSLIEDQKQTSDVKNIKKIKNFKMPPEYKPLF